MIFSGSPRPVKAKEPELAETVPGAVAPGVAPAVLAPGAVAAAGATAGLGSAVPGGVAGDVCDPGLGSPVPGGAPGDVWGPPGGVFGGVTGVVGGTVAGGGAGAPRKEIGADTSSWPVSMKTRAHFTPRTCWTGDGGHGVILRVSVRSLAGAVGSAATGDHREHTARGPEFPSFVNHDDRRQGSGWSRGGDAPERGSTAADRKRFVKGWPDVHGRLAGGFVALEHVPLGIGGEPGTGDRHLLPARETGGRGHRDRGRRRGGRGCLEEDESSRHEHEGDQPGHQMPLANVVNESHRVPPLWVGHGINASSYLSTAIGEFRTEVLARGDTSRARYGFTSAPRTINSDDPETSGSCPPVPPLTVEMTTEGDQMWQVVLMRTSPRGGRCSRRARSGCRCRWWACTCCNGCTAKHASVPALIFVTRSGSRSSALAMATNEKPSDSARSTVDELVDAAQQDEGHVERGAELPGVGKEERLLEGVVRHESVAHDPEPEAQRPGQGGGELLTGSLAPEQVHRVGQRAAAGEGRARRERRRPRAVGLPRRFLRATVPLAPRRPC